MSRYDVKGKRFEFLIERIDKAISDGYYVEAMSLTYALFEERTYSLLDKLKIPYNSKDKLFKCLIRLKEYIANQKLSIISSQKPLPDIYNFLENELINNNLIDNVLAWKKHRDDVIHDLAKQNIPYSSIQIDAQSGRDYFRQYTAIIMRLKKLL